MENHGRPKFLPSFFDVLSKRARKESFVSLLPWWMVGAAGLGAAGAYFVRDEFWGWDKVDISTAVYAAVLTLNGLVLALSWNAFSKIYDYISSAKFAAFLRKHDLLHGYIVYVGFVHFFQVMAVVVSSIGLMTLLMDLHSLVVERIILATIIAVSVYALKMAIGAVHVMHDLIWQKSLFDAHDAETNTGNVVAMNRGN